MAGSGHGYFIAIILLLLGAALLCWQAQPEIPITPVNTTSPTPGKHDAIIPPPPEQVAPTTMSHSTPPQPKPVATSAPVDAPPAVQSFTISGTVFDAATLEPLPGVCIALNSIDHQEISHPLQTISGDDGTYLLTMPPNSRWSNLNFSKSGYLTVTDYSISGAERQHDILLEPSRIITGIVLDCNGNPVPNASIIQIIPNSYDTQIQLRSTLGLSEIRPIPASDTEGKFCLAFIDSNEPRYLLAAIAENRVAIGKVDSDTIILREDQGGVLEISPSDGSQLSQDIYINWVHESGLCEYLETQSRMQWPWRITKMPSGQYRIEIRDGNSDTVFLNKTMYLDGHSTYPLTIDQVSAADTGSWLGGRVVDAMTGAGICKVLVEIVAAGRTFTEYTGDDGGFVFQNLTAILTKAQLRKGGNYLDCFEADTAKLILNSSANVIVLPRSKRLLIRCLPVSPPMYIMY